MTEQLKSQDLGSKSDIVSDLMQINNLQYSIGRSLSVCTSSNYVYEPLNISGVNSGPNRTVQRTLNTGSSFVHGGRCYLVMNVKFIAKTAGGASVPFGPRNDALGLNAEDYAHFGEGSILNIIDQVEIRSKDGVEIHVDRQANDLNNILLQYEYSTDWLNKSGSLMGHTTGKTDHDTNSDNKTVQGAFSEEGIGKKLYDGFNFVIPMSAISRLFAYDRLLPSQLMSGLSISIKFKDTEDAFVWVDGGNGAANFTYEVSDAYMRIATCDLADSMQSKIATMSEGKGGLKILIDDFHYERQQITKNANVNVRANIAQATQMICKTQQADQFSNIYLDPFKPAGCAIERYHFRHGSSQYPKTEVTNESDNYQMTMNSFNKNHGKNDTGSISYNNWIRRARVTCIDLSRGDLELSGVSLSNSKTLSFNAVYQFGVNPKYVDTWVRHSKLISVFLNNCVVES